MGCSQRNALRHGPRNIGGRELPDKSKLLRLLPKLQPEFCEAVSHIRRNSCSSMTFTFSFCAFSSFVPASSPASTKSVFLLTLLLALPPNDSTFAVASSRVIVGSVPVRTNVLP